MPPGGFRDVEETGWWAEERAAAGEPLRGWRAWAALAARACPAHVAEAAAEISAAALRRRLPDLSTLKALGDPWLCQQLRVLEPAHYRALYQPQTSMSFAALPETAGPATKP